MLDIVALGLAATPTIMASYKKNRAMVQKLIDEDRDPTDEEWAEITAETDALMVEILSDGDEG